MKKSVMLTDDESEIKSLESQIGETTIYAKHCEPNLRAKVERVETNCFCM
jgi:hypothetical protein